MKQSLTVSDYLPESLSKTQDTCKTPTDQMKNYNCFENLHCNKALNKFIGACFQPLVKHAAAELPYKTKEKKWSQKSCFRLKFLISLSQKTFWEWKVKAKRRFRIINDLLERTRMLQSRRLDKSTETDKTFSRWLRNSSKQKRFVAYYTTLNSSPDACDFTL